MNFLVFVDTCAGELEKILSGVKSMLVKETNLEQPEEQPVEAGDSLFFLRDNDECAVRVKATAVRVLPCEEHVDEDLEHILKELQPKLQLTEDQYNYWSVKKHARFVEFEAAQKIPEFHIAPSKITDRTRWTAFEEIGEVTEEGADMEPTGISQAESGEEVHPDVQTLSEGGTKAKLLAVVEVLLLYGVFQGVAQAWRTTEIFKWEVQNLGWSYIGGLLFFLPALVIWLSHRKWADYGISSANWRTNLDIGIKAFLVTCIPFVLGLGGLQLLGWDYRNMNGGALAALTDIVAIAIMIRILNRHKPVASGRANLVLIAVLLVLPVGIALWMGKLNLVIVSTVIWQFALSGFGEEFMYRGYFQGRLNQAFGRPYKVFGIQFGPGLLFAALLFGLMHAFNGYNPAVGPGSMYWGWALWTFFGGLFGGIIREKTGTLLAPGIAHGLPDAIGEPLRILMGWA